MKGIWMLRTAGYWMLWTAGNEEYSMRVNPAIERNDIL